MRITAVDVVIIVLLGLSLFSFSTKYEPKYTFEFSGSQIIKVVRECDILDSTGFLYTVYVRGYWNTDVGHFEEEAFVCATGRSNLEIVLKNGKMVTVGGKMSYKEDVQAVDIEIRLKSKSSVVYDLEPVKGSKNDIKEYVEESSQFITYEKEDIAVTCILTLGTDTSLEASGTEDVSGLTDPFIIMEAEIEDSLRKEVFFMKKADVEVYDDGVTVSVERLSMKEFDTFFEVLEKYITIQEIYTGNIIVYYQTSEEIDVNDVVPLESYTESGVSNVHVRV
ncbi:MAG: hypothetical protein HXS44_13705 [Theionarchaea archaeon]|nr:hypothetical protein [Theionarchaea archaeon]